MKLIDRVFKDGYMISVYSFGKEKIYKLYEGDIFLDSCVYSSKKNYRVICKLIFSRLVPVWKQLVFNF